MNSLFACPLCQAPLDAGPRAYTCPNGHSFDRAGAGYVHLLPPNRMHSKSPGDDRKMVAARAAFLERGYYAPLAQALGNSAVRLLSATPQPVVLDSGCGEGSSTRHLFLALCAAGLSPRLAGVDISKFAVRRAAKRLEAGEFAVASVYRLPLPDHSADLVTNVFAPLCQEEFARVLKSGGHFLYVVPAPRHLWQMKEILYHHPYENPDKREEYPGFRLLDVQEVEGTIHLSCQEDIMALFGMTPYAWKTPREGIARLSALDALSCETGFRIHHYQRL